MKPNSKRFEVRNVSYSFGDEAPYGMVQSIIQDGIYVLGAYLLRNPLTGHFIQVTEGDFNRGVEEERIRVDIAYQASLGVYND